jgi:hypothetical protein
VANLLTNALFTMFTGTLLLTLLCAAIRTSRQVDMSACSTRPAPAFRGPRADKLNRAAGTFPVTRATGIATVADICNISPGFDAAEVENMIAFWAIPDAVFVSCFGR